MKNAPLLLLSLCFCFSACAGLNNAGYELPVGEESASTEAELSTPDPAPAADEEVLAAHVRVHPMPGPDANALWHYITVQNPYKAEPTDSAPNEDGGWHKFPGIEKEIYPYRVEEEPHGEWVGVYVNQPAHDSISQPSKPFNMDYASILIKENYSPVSGDPSKRPPHKNLDSLTVMYKVRGYKTHTNGEEWFWAMFGCKEGNCNGTVATLGNQPWIDQNIAFAPTTKYSFFKGEVQAGKPWFCLSCHQSAATPAGGGGKAYGDYVWQLIPFHPTN